MQKLFAFFAIVLLCGYTFAQNNTSTVTDNGSDNTAFVNQVGDVNTAIVNQTGNSNIADKSDIYPSSLYGTLNAKGITQNGSSNTGEITQNNAHVGVVSAGPIAGMGQYGDNNAATITQSGNTAWMQGYVWSEQDGNGNSSTQNQEKVSYAFSHVKQVGDENTAETQQQFGGYGQRANILQTGDGNNAYQEQGSVSGYTETNLAEITQVGNTNTSYQSQVGSHNTSSALINGDLNTTNQTQTGNGNLSTVKVGFQDVPTYMSDNNNVTVGQTGDNNEASFGLTMGNDNTVNISQDGNTNYTEIGVKYGDANDLTETVTGNGNRTRLSLNADWGSKSSNNTVEITKDGDGNYVAGSIKGSSNDITVSQTGDNNRVGTSWYTGDGINVTGDMNTVDVSQSGNGNSSINTVAGSNNSIMVNQSN